MIHFATGLPVRPVLSTALRHTTAPWLAVGLGCAGQGFLHVVLHGACMSADQQQQPNLAAGLEPNHSCCCTWGHAIGCSFDSRQSLLLQGGACAQRWPAQPAQFFSAGGSFGRCAVGSLWLSAPPGFVRYGRGPRLLLASWPLDDLGTIRRGSAWRRPTLTPACHQSQSCRALEVLCVDTSGQAWQAAVEAGQDQDNLSGFCVRACFGKRLLFCESALFRCAHLRPCVHGLPRVAFSVVHTCMHQRGHQPV